MYEMPVKSWVTHPLMDAESGKAGKSTQTASSQGPGRWTYKKPTTSSKSSLDYQEQVTGRPAWWCM